jgi:hypothetical protein
MKQPRVLSNLLRAIVDEWGFDQAEAALSRLRRDGVGSIAHLDSNQSSRTHKAKPNPIELIEKGDFEDAKREVLLKIADRFEKKDFLPSTADVREFVFHLGERPNGLKDRKDGFRVLLKSLSRLSTERLRQIEHDAQYSGPSQLGPLSDAIANAGARRQVSDLEVARADQLTSHSRDHS